MFQVFRVPCCFTLLASRDGGKDFIRNVFYIDPNAIDRKISQEDNVWPLSMKVNNIHNHLMAITKVILSVWTPNHGGGAGSRSVTVTNAAARWDILKLQIELRK